MTGEEEAEQFLLQFELLQFVHLRDLGPPVGGCGFVAVCGSNVLLFPTHKVEHVGLARLAVLPEQLGLPNGPVQIGKEEGSARFHRVEPTRLYEALQHPLVDRLAVYALDQVRKTLVGSTPLPFIHDQPGRRVPHSLDRSEAESDGVARPLLALDRGKAVSRLIDVRAEHPNLHLRAFRNEVGKLVRIAQLAGKDPRHEGNRMVGLQVSGLVADDAIGRGVRLVEAIARKFFQDVEDLVRLLLVDLVDLLSPLHENFPLLGHFLGLLLAHGPPQDVGSAKRITCNPTGRLHDLLLIDHDPVGLLADILEQRMRKLDGGGILLALDVVGNPLHGARAVEGDEGDHLVDVGNGHLPAKSAHALRLQLKDSDRTGLVE